MNALPVPAFRPARPDEADTVLALYKSVLGSPFCVWDEDYPTADNVRDDLARGDLFVLTEPDGGGRDGIIGAISLCTPHESDELAPWSELDAAEFARVVIRPDRQGMDLARQLVAGIEREIAARGIPWVHLLVAPVNKPAYRTYLSGGYVPVGEADVYGHHYVCCEKRVPYTE